MPAQWAPALAGRVPAPPVSSYWDGGEAEAEAEAEREAALAAVEAEDGSVNRGLLLKFLGSVDS